MINQKLPIPSFFDASKVGSIWQVPYAQRLAEIREWASQNNIRPIGVDSPKVALMLIDIQNTFCIPTGELFVGGRSGNGAVEDNVRLCRYIYENMWNITSIIPTLDTHRNIAIFHEIFWIDDNGNHPTPGVTMISSDDIKNGTWKVNPAVATVFGGDYMALQRYALEYTDALAQKNKFSLIIWPFHAMLGGIGHALVSSVEEAIFTHSIARSTMPDFQIKGGNPLTENYSILAPEVRNSANKAQKNTEFINNLLNYDIIVIAGQAKSHCVLFTINDLADEIQNIDPQLFQKVFILEDGMSSVVVPGVLDFTDETDKKFEEFKQKGMNIVTTQKPLYELV